MKYVHPNDCECYECVGSRFAYTDNGHKFVENNMKHHTFGQPCGDCGRPRTEYRDLGRKGYYVCWWCNHRTNADQYNPPELPEVA